MSRFFGYSHYYVLQEQRRRNDDGVSYPQEGFTPLGRTFMVLGVIALVGAIIACIALLN